MKLIDRLDNYLLDNVYEIIIKENKINIINYHEIVDFSPTKITVEYRNKTIIIEGKNLTISEMLDNEVMLTGDIVNVRINN